MRALILLLLACSCWSFHIKTQTSTSQVGANQRIPSYLGKGYHLIQGNPFTDRIDPGFRNEIFNFTYTQGLVTDDGKYSIPDFTHSAASLACSLQSKESQFSGTQNYQNELSSATTVDTRYSVPFVSAAFSLSATFSEFSNSTNSQKRTLTQAFARCEAYEIEMPIYTNEIQLTEDFMVGVRNSTVNGQWEEFINHFGTHYATKIIFGGTSLYQHEYQQETMSYFKSMNLDINIAAKVQFANMFNVSMSEDLKRYQNQTNLITKKVQSTKYVIVGGEPPKTGNWIDWERTVKDNLAPISYDLTALTVLFNYIPNLDVAKATSSLNSYITSYCQGHHCPPLTPEKPAPKPLVVTFSQQPDIHGKDFAQPTYDTLDAGVKVGMRITKVLMGIKQKTDSIQFFLSDGLIEHTGMAVGDRIFNHEYNVPANDEIKCIRFGISYFRDFWQFASMQFITKNNVESQVYSGTNPVSQYQTLCLPGNDDHLVGFHGHYGTGTFDSIGFDIMTEKFQP